MNRKYIIGFSIFLIIVIIVIFLLYNKNTSTNILNNPKKFNKLNSLFISNRRLPNSIIGNKYSYSLWIYFLNMAENAEWNANVNYKKTILYRNGSPNIYYYPLKNHLELQFAYKDKLNEIDYYKINIDTLNIQTWNNIIIVLNNRMIDIFINGKRYTSAYLPNVPIIYNKSLYIGEKNNNFNGYLNKIKYFNHSLTENDAKKIYHSDINSMPMIKY